MVRELLARGEGEAVQGSTPKPQLREPQDTCQERPQAPGPPAEPGESALTKLTNARKFPLCGAHRRWASLGRPRKGFADLIVQ